MGSNRGKAHFLRGTIWGVRSRLRNEDWAGALHAGITGLANTFNGWARMVRQPRFRCSCCGSTGYAFIHMSNRLRIAWNSLCPECRSRSRHRGLALLIRQLVEKEPGIRRVLHFAPEPLLG